MRSTFHVLPLPWARQFATSLAQSATPTILRAGHEVPNARIEAGRVNANQAPEKPVIPRPPGADGPPRGTSGRAWRPDGAVYYGQGLTACGVDHRRGSTTIATGRPSAANRAMRSTAAAAALWQITKYSRPYRRRSVARSSSSSPWSPSRTSSAGSMIAAPPLRWPGAVRPPAVPHGGPPGGATVARRCLSGPVLRRTGVR
jgi:hypothetical protein